MEIALGIVLMVLAVAIIFLVLAQSGKDKRLSGAIAGSAETFFTKGKGKSKDKILAAITTALSFVFVILSVILYIYVSGTVA